MAGIESISPSTLVVGGKRNQPIPITTLVVTHFYAGNRPAFAKAMAAMEIISPSTLVVGGKRNQPIPITTLVVTLPLPPYGL